MKGTIKWEHEWHYYSAFAITASLTFLVIQFSTGTPQAVGVAFSALVATFLFSSDSWKALPVEVHQWGIFLSVMVAMIIGFVLYLLSDRKTIK